MSLVMYWWFSDSSRNITNLGNVSIGTLTYEDVTITGNGHCRTGVDWTEWSYRSNGGARYYWCW